MAIRGKDVKTVFLIGLALISYVANGADHLGSRRHLLHDNVCIIDVTKLGVKAGPGHCTENTASLMNAWVQACESAVPAKIIIPAGTYEMGPVNFQGPCKSPITFELLGTVQAATDVKLYKDLTWFHFEEIDRLHLTGSGKGVFDGQGDCFWKLSTCRSNNQCKISLPSSIKFRRITNSVISGFTSLNSPAFHMHVISSNNFTAHSLNIIAPDESPNTDGMHISTSCNVKVLNSRIGTGDDCLSVGQGNSDITISGIDCGPGHGISVGSLGKYSDETDVKNVLVTDCTLTKTTNGARIKTWLASPTLKASNITFQNIIMNMVKNPIIIDQEYGAKRPEPSNVALTGVQFKNIRGTSISEFPVSLICSKKFPCCVDMTDVDLVYKGEKELIEKAECVSAKVNFLGKQNPPPCRC
ncbi:hypothetical protein ACOSP7_000460 [Xanthoceras sorbifolium]|uniref:Exopolygalacturonase n=1 Tax=Xanthoceras sorbifolium TaxID=99658 RepID=A0ABQ8IPH1_9ROSI|nr:hypothetical protein JRO89_XS01G0366500 [Xanthoceras sorbifolium]